MKSAPIQLNFTPKSKESVYAQFRQSIISGLNDEHIKPGQKVSSIRNLVTEFGISAAAVRKAFDQLIAEGWLEVRHGSGTFVSRMSPVLAQQAFYSDSTPATFVDLKAEEVGFRSFSPDDWMSVFPSEVVREMSEQPAMVRSVRALSKLNAKPFPEACSGNRFERAVELWRGDCRSARLSLTEPAGGLELREYLANWLNQSRGMSCSAANVLILNNLAECRSFIARLFISEGTPVMVEDPSVNALWLKACKASLRPVALDESGVIAEDLDKLNDARLAYVTPSLQIPTGAVLSRSRRQKLLEWADRKNVLLVEDDSNCEFSYDSRIIPPIYSFDGNDRTIYIGSLNNIMPLEMRLAFLVLPDTIRGAFTRLKSIANRCTSPLVQRLVLRLFETEYIQERIRKLQRIMDQKRRLLIEHLIHVDAVKLHFSPAKSGVFQTVWLAPEIDDVGVAQLCDSDNIVAIKPCHISPGGRSGLVIGFAEPSEKLVASVKTLNSALIRASH